MAAVDDAVEQRKARLIVGGMLLVVFGVPLLLVLLKAWLGS